MGELDAFERNHNNFEIEILPIDERIHESLFPLPAPLDNMPDIFIRFDRVPGLRQQIDTPYAKVGRMEIAGAILKRIEKSAGQRGKNGIPDQ